MYKGTIIRSSNFHNPDYWVVKCDNNEIRGSRNGELPIDESNFESFNARVGQRVEFILADLGMIHNYKTYARIIKTIAP